MTDYTQAIIMGFFAGLGSFVANYFGQKYLQPNFQRIEKSVKDNHEKIRKIGEIIKEPNSKSEKNV